MFFAPPKVKSLSRYAEYGAYLGNRHFLVMLAVAITAHLAIIAVYSMVPSQQIVKIPVRVLNIKLAGGSSTAAMHMPMPVPPQATKVHEEAQDAAPESAEDMEPVTEKNAESVVDKALAKKLAKAASHTKAHLELAKLSKAEHAASDTNKKIRSVHVPVSESAFTTPKKYVREVADASDGTAGSWHAKGGNGNGGEVSGEVGGTEVIKRYTQTLSQWIQNHQIYAKAACGEAVAVGGQCNAKGKVTVRLRIDRDGHIIPGSLSVDTTSGQELVDQAAITMVHASEPMPSVPSNVSESQLEFLIPVQVDLSKQ